MPGIGQRGDGKEDRSAWAVTYNGSAWPQYSYASPTFRSELAKDFTAYLGGLKGQRNISVLLLHNEPGYHWIADRVFDYNPLAVTRFRVWLRRQHGSLETLNEHWGTHWASFDAVEPPRDLPPVANLAAWLDWRRFHADLIQDCLHEEVALAHLTLPGVPATTNLSGPLDDWYPVRLGDNYRYTDGLDLLVASAAFRSFLPECRTPDDGDGPTVQKRAAWASRHCPRIAPILLGNCWARRSIRLLPV